MDLWKGWRNAKINLLVAQKSSKEYVCGLGMRCWDLKIFIRLQEVQGIKEENATPRTEDHSFKRTYAHRYTVLFSTVTKR